MRKLIKDFNIYFELGVSSKSKKMMAIIKKGIKKEYFEDILSGRKKYELRLGSLDIKEGDTLILEE